MNMGKAIMNCKRMLEDGETLIRKAKEQANVLRVDASPEDLLKLNKELFRLRNYNV